MADKTINDLTATTSLADGDLFEIENASNNSRKITWANVKAALQTTGTFTPVVAFGGASVGVTYTTQVGRYIKTHNLCVATVHIVLSSKGSSTGTLTITGLPFTSRNVSNYHQAAAIMFLGTPAGKILQAWVPPNSTALSFLDANASTLATDADVSAASEFIITLAYEVEP